MEPKPTEKVEQAEQAKRKSIGAFIRFTATTLVFLAVFAVFWNVFNAKRQNKIPTFFGYSFSIVVTGSMEPDIKVGELLVVKETDIENIEVGDDIMFVSLSGVIQGEHVVHRVVEKDTDEEGIFLRTKGVNNPISDTDLVRRGNFVGKAVAHSAFFGKIFGFLSDSRTIMMAVVLLLVVPFVIKQIIKIIRIAKSKDGEETENDKENEENKDTEKKND